MTLTRREFSALPLAALAAPPKLSRRWTIYVIQHSHIDVGYTERQEVIASYHQQFLRQALESALSPRQKDRASECRFRFTMEGFWQVEQFLNSASAADRARFIQAMRDDLLELTAFYFHLTELPDQELLRTSLKYSAAFAKAEKLQLTAAMACDINGFSWGMSEVRAEGGIRYLSTNINPHHGGYPFGKPLVPFWWETPSGRRLLVWSGMAYHKANLFGLMGRSAPAGDPGIPGFYLPGPDGFFDTTTTDVAERKLFPFLQWLEQSGYPYDFLPLMGSGTYTDNSPPNEDYCSILAQWNSRFGSQVRVRSATLGEFFTRLESVSSSLPVHRGEWTDWWSDGVASSPEDTTLYRNALRARRLVTRLDPQARLVPPADLDAIDRKLLLYAEHTFGYSNTAVPTLLSDQVFKRKSLHAIQADELASAALNRILAQRGEGEFAAGRPFSYTLLNPSSERVRAAVALPVDFFETPFLLRGFEVRDAQGRVMPHQLEPSPRGRSVFVFCELEPNARRRLELVPAAESNATESPAGASFENEFYRIAWSQQSGIVSWTHRPTGTELLATQRGGLGCPVYQIFPKATRYEAGKVSGERHRPAAEVSFGNVTAIRRASSGPIFERWIFTYSVSGTTEASVELVCYRNLPHIDLTFRAIKTNVADPEGLYAHFPLALPNARWYFDKPGAVIRPGIDQLPGACCDYYCLQKGAALSAPGLGVAWATLDAPLVHLNGLNLWHFTTQSSGEGPLYSWLTNNKWETNFRLYLGGGYSFRYRLEAAAQYAKPEAAIARLSTLSQPPLVLRD
ncbi:MAG: hypothetical protein HY821_01400 [Acidobacteria bacterium]|nr:hypothetical protein [Acidobacteriota bacterium]